MLPRPYPLELLLELFKVEPDENDPKVLQAASSIAAVGREGSLLHERAVFTVVSIDAGVIRVRVTCINASNELFEYGPFALFVGGDVDIRFKTSVDFVRDKR